MDAIISQAPLTSIGFEIWSVMLVNVIETY